MANGHLTMRARRLEKDTEGSLLLMAMRLLVLISLKVRAHCHKEGHFAREVQSLPRKSKTTRPMKTSRRSVPVKHLLPYLWFHCKNSKAMSSEEEPKVVRKNDDAPIIEEWVSDSEEENVSQTKTEKKIVKPSIAKIEFVKPKQQEKTTRKTVKQVEKHRQNTYSPRGNQRNWNNMMSQKLGNNFEMFNKACYVCGSFNHLQVDCNCHQKQFQNQRMVKPVWNNAQRVNHQNFAKKTHPYAKKNLVPRAVLMKSGLVSVNTLLTSLILAYSKNKSDLSMIGSLMHLTSSRPDITFAVYACARYQVNPKVSHLHAVKRIFRYLKGQSKSGLWYPKYSPFDLVAYTDSDYARASLETLFRMELELMLVTQS
ncbi:hypothetical protein Tco_0271073 [Tanacetum coccineum]